MLIIPAIDLKGGKCVRLQQGDFNRVTIYSDSPAEVAQKWEMMGAERIHIVDLDGSLAGSPRNMSAINNIVAGIAIPVQIGGGIRNMNTVETLLGMGVSRVILGTAALKQQQFVIDACSRFPGRIILGIDAKDGNVAVEGWTENSGTSAIELARFYEQYRPDAVVYTDIKRDGMETGVNLKSTQELALSISIPVIASGGVSGISDIVDLRNLEGDGITGVIIGKALYNDTLSLDEAIKAARGDKR